MVKADFFSRPTTASSSNFEWLPCFECIPAAPLKAVAAAAVALALAAVALVAARPLRARRSCAALVARTAPASMDGAQLTCRPRADLTAAGSVAAAADAAPAAATMAAAWGAAAGPWPWPPAALPTASLTTAVKHHRDGLSRDSSASAICLAFSALTWASFALHQRAECKRLV